MTDEEKRVARNAYQQDWRRRNPDRVRAISSKCNAGRKEKASAYEKKYRVEKGEELLAKKREHMRLHRLANIEMYKARSKVQYAKHEERRKTTSAAWREKNREKLRLDAAARYARVRIENGTSARAEWRDFAAVERASVILTSESVLNPQLDELRNEKLKANGLIQRPLTIEQRIAKSQKSKDQHYANREKRLQQKKSWYEANKIKALAYSSGRRGKIREATPLWANSFFIEEAYDIAAKRTQMLGFPWEVDHVVPLLSPIVCGLHVEHNLRVVPKTVNRSKGNWHWPDMP